jgi:DNA-binding NarL/FixJ family response regulator
MPRLTVVVEFPIAVDHTQLTAHLARIGMKVLEIRENARRKTDKWVILKVLEMAHKGVKQKDIARRLNVSTASVSKWVNEDLKRAGARAAHVSEDLRRK